jgi:hypothetical protein
MSTQTSEKKYFCYCNGCTTEAKSIKIKKMGPNEGKMFYTCPNSQTRKGGCTYGFIEGDENNLEVDYNNKRCKNKLNPHPFIKRKINKVESVNYGKNFWVCECTKTFEIIQ